MDYQSQKRNTIVDDGNKMYRKARSLKVKGQSPGPGHYKPIMDIFDLKIENK